MQYNCSDLHQSTLQASYLRKQLYLDHDLIRLNLWDTVSNNVRTTIECLNEYQLIAIKHQLQLGRSRKVSRFRPYLL